MKRVLLSLTTSFFIFSTSYSQEKTFITEFFLDFTGPSQKTINLDSGNYIFEVSGTFCLGSCWNGDTRDVRYYFNDPQQPGIILVEDHNAFTINEYCPQDTTGCTMLSPVETNYQEDHVYNYNVSFEESGDQTIYGVADECCWGDNQGGLTFKVYSVVTGEDILLNGTVSAENNQIKNVADPTDPQDVLTLNYFNSISDKDPELGQSDNQISDIDGNTYDTVQINSVVWSESNLRVKTYRDGTPIQQATSENFESISAGAWAYVNDDPSTEVEYGLLYNFACVTNPRGLAPKGTRIPTKIDFFNLMNSVMNGDSIEDGFHRIKSESGWTYDGVNYNGNNSSGFNLKPAGRVFFTDNNVFGMLTEIHTSDLFNQTYNNQYFNTRFKVQFNSNSNYFNDNYNYSSVRVILN